MSDSTPSGASADASAIVPPVVARSLAQITDRLVGEHDGLTVLTLVTQACRGLLRAQATGVLLLDPRGGLRVAAASDERARFIELLQAFSDQGPCSESIRTGEIVEVYDLPSTADRWPAFARAAVDAGYTAVVALPMRLDGQPVGGLNLLYTANIRATAAERELGQALADLAILGLSQDQRNRRARRFSEYTLTTLNDRVHVAHAIGYLAGALGLDPEQARIVFTEHANSHRINLADLARDLTSGVLRPIDIAAPAVPPNP
jgi:GAF domain-containing protein